MPNEQPQRDSELDGLLKSIRIDDCSPAPSQQFRDQVMFRAGETVGRVTARRAGELWAWRGIAAAMVIVAGLSLRRDRTSEIASMVPAVQIRSGVVAAHSPTVESVALNVETHADTYLRIRQAVLRDGIAALPETERSPSSPPASAMSVKGILGDD